MVDTPSLEGVLVARLATRVLTTSELPKQPVDWDRVLEIAAHERCASLIWHRNAALIRSAAPAELAARWRARTLATGVAAREQLAELAEVVDALADAGVTPIVLKGIPLGVMLYGDVAARPVTDSDLFIPVAQRSAAHEGLRRIGYRHLYGTAPAEGAYERVHDGRRSVVEVHSSLLDEELLAHLRIPPAEGAPVDLEGTPVYAQSGPLLPLFLATHLAKHADVPLLWWIDLATVWVRLDAADRQAVRARALEHRLQRHLAWAESGIELLDAVVSSGDDAIARDALARLRALHVLHPARRLARLSAGVRDAARSILAWAWPRHARRDPRALLRHLIARARSFRARFRPRLDDVSAARPHELRGLAVSGEQLMALVREVVGGGASMWIRARGSSMFPTIKDGALVRLVPLPARQVRRGDVVFAAMRGGEAVIHRVRSVDAETLVLQGDNMPFPDAALPVGALVALVDTVQQDTRASVIGPRPPLNPSGLLARWRAIGRARRLQRTVVR